MSRINENAPIKHIISSGSSGSGKSYYIKNLIKKQNPSRLLVWDTADEFGGVPDIKRVDNIQSLYGELIRNTMGKYRLVCDDDHYTAFTKLAKAWGNWDLGESVVVIEEGAAVSNIGKSAKGELQLITQGRKYGISVCYIIQSLAEGSKTALKNINIIRIGSSDELDIKYLTNRYGKDLGDSVRSLKGYDYIVFDKTEKEFVVTRA